jgi:hypothetical protein
VQSPTINRPRQDLAWQFPEAALVLAVRYGENVPLLWGWLAGVRPSKKYDRLYVATVYESFRVRTTALVAVATLTGLKSAVAQTYVEKLCGSGYLRGSNPNSDDWQTTSAVTLGKCWILKKPAGGP